MKASDSFEAERAVSEGVSWVAVALLLAGLSLLIIVTGYKASALLDGLSSGTGARAVQGRR